MTSQNDDNETINEIQALAGRHDARARKDATLNMRVSSQFLEEVKQTAQAQGFDKYQQWVLAVLEEAVANATKTSK